MSGFEKAKARDNSSNKLVSLQSTIRSLEEDILYSISARKAMPKFEKIKDMHTMIMAQNQHFVKKDGFPTSGWER